MFKVEEAILKARRKSEQARMKNRSNLTSRPASARGLLRAFNIAFSEAGYGTPPMATKKVLGMLNTFIRMSRRENREDKWLYDLMSEVVKNWERIAQEKITTPKGKIFAISRAPSLNDFLTCRESILALIEASHCRVDCVEESKSQRVIETGKSIKHGPSEEDMQKEMEKFYEQY